MLVNLLIDNTNPEIKDYKLSLAVYIKQLYREIQAEGYNTINEGVTLQHIELLFMCFENQSVDLKQKLAIHSALEQMLILYNYQKSDNQSYVANIKSILNKISQLCLQGVESQNNDVLKSAFMLVEVMYSNACNQTHTLVIEECMGNFYRAIENYLNLLNADILALNTSLEQDQLQFTTQNPLVQSVMQKIDLISAFIRMIYRVLEKVTQSSGSNFFLSYYEFVRSEKLALILVRVFGIGVQIPKSPNNNSVLNITGLQ